MIPCRMLQPIFVLLHGVLAGFRSRRDVALDLVLRHRLHVTLRTNATPVCGAAASACRAHCLEAQLPSERWSGDRCWVASTTPTPSNLSSDRLLPRFSPPHRSWPGLTRGGCRCRIGRFGPARRGQFRPDKPECAVGGFHSAGEAVQVFEITTPGVCPQPAQVVQSSVERCLRGQESCHMLHRVMALTLLSGAA
jgi:hypothetical protein